MGKANADMWDKMMRPETRTVHGGEVYPSGPYVICVVMSVFGV